MSWSGFKKAASRAGTQVMMKTGHVEKTSDRSYEVEERRYRTLESASLRLQKEAKGYLDSLRAMTASQMRIAETIDAFYGEAGAKDGVSRSYKQAVEDLDAETVKALDGPYRCVMGEDVRAGAFEEGVLGQGVVEQVYEGASCGRERRNIGLVAQRRRGCDGGVAQRESEGFATAHKLMETVYRTTVLEPISRFCAYFPDINECIKKRNNKLLDYDAVRAKV
ncbi:BAR adaptor protein Hob3, partial [Teratosphaeriaceae sp. CCFEE 6253]